MIAYTPWIFLYLVSALTITGWMFAALHRDKVTDRYEWGNDLRLSLIIGFIFGLLGPFTVALFWVLTWKAEFGWTLIPDRKP